MRINICPICVSVGGAWFILSAIVAWGYLGPQQLIIPISILMGGSVVGIAYQGIQKCEWASSHPLLWKSLIIFLGMPVSYFLVSNLSKRIVIIEFVLLLITAYFFFIERPKKPSGSGESQVRLGESQKIRDIEEKMRQCC